MIAYVLLLGEYAGFDGDFQKYFPSKENRIAFYEGYLNLMKLSPQREHASSIDQLIQSLMQHNNDEALPQAFYDGFDVSRADRNLLS